MTLATWWRGDTLPELPSVPALHVEQSGNVQLLTQVSNQQTSAIVARMEAAHVAYVARLGETPVAYGWVALRQGGIDEFQLTFTVPGANRYLWDFVTLPAWRGRGVYPALLQAIITLESVKAERFWIMYEPNNYTSERGIQRAGFSRVADTACDGARIVGLFAPNTERAQAGAQLLGVPLLVDQVRGQYTVC